MNAHVFSRPALGIAATIVMLTGCGGSGTSTSGGPSLPVAAQFNLNFVNSVISGTTPSSISLQLQDWTKNCLQLSQPFSDAHLAYKASAQRMVSLLDCGTAGSFTVRFHALDVPLADTTIQWTVLEPGLSESTVQQGGLCVKQIGGLALTETIIAKPPSGCPKT